jgi:hypothetical protein
VIKDRSRVPLTNVEKKTAIRTFIDNVANLIIEQCLVDGITELITPTEVYKMSDEKLGHLGSESDSLRDHRNNLLSREKKLNEALAICKINSISAAAGKFSRMIQPLPYRLSGFPSNLKPNTT